MVSMLRLLPIVVIGMASMIALGIIGVLGIQLYGPFASALGGSGAGIGVTAADVISYRLATIFVLSTALVVPVGIWLIASTSGGAPRRQQRERRRH